MNELKHELVDLLNKHNLTISEFDELISFMQRIKNKAKLTFEFDNSDDISNLEQYAYNITNYSTDPQPLTERVWLL